MPVKVTLKYLRHSPRKIRPVAKLIVGQKLERALDLTSVPANDSARFINKALKMVQAAAKQKEYDPSELTVQQVLANQGPKIKRMRAGSKSYQNRYLKHLAHLTVIVDEVKAKKPIPAKKTTEVKSDQDLKRKKEDGTKS